MYARRSQQQFDRQYELLESRFLAQQRRDATLLHHLQLISSPQITDLAPYPFDTFVAASSRYDEGNEDQTRGLHMLLLAVPYATRIIRR